MWGKGTTKRNARQPTKTRSTEDSVKDGLSVVVGVVTDGYDFGTRLKTNALEEGIPFAPADLLDADRVFFREFGDVTLVDGTGER